MSFTVKLGYGGLYSKCSKCFVKLTDSSLKSLEEYQTKSLKTGLKIQFDGTEGFLQVPVRHSGGKELIKSYSFNFTPESNDGLTECFGSANSNGPFKHLGAFSHKLVIKASDDVFQNTLEKMSMVEQESKKNCIKEIKFKDHERKMANFKSKHSAAPLEPKKILVVPKPRKPEAAIKPNQTYSVNDSFDFTARKNTRVAPLKKRPAPDTSQCSSPAASLPDASSQVPASDPLHGNAEAPVIKKPRIAHKGKETMDAMKSLENDTQDVSDEKDYESTYPPICNPEEAYAYRCEYEKDYATYGELHQKNHDRLVKFNQFVEDLKHETFKTDSYMNVLSKIYFEYDRLQKNQQHVEEKMRFTDLHKKLHVLKRRIVEYECQNDGYSTNN